MVWLLVPGFALLFVTLTWVLPYYFAFGVDLFYPFGASQSLRPPPLWYVPFPIIFLATILVGMFKFRDLIDFMIGKWPPTLRSGHRDFEVNKDWIRRVEVSLVPKEGYRLLFELKSGKDVEFRVSRNALGRTNPIEKLLDIVGRFCEGQPLTQNGDAITWRFKP